MADDITDDERRHYIAAIRRRAVKIVELCDAEPLRQLRDVDDYLLAVHIVLLFRLTLPVVAADARFNLMSWFLLQLRKETARCFICGSSPDPKDGQLCPKCLEEVGSFDGLDDPTPGGIDESIIGTADRRR